VPPVVCDSGPLIHLAQINRLQILQRLFGEVQVTGRVKGEVVDEGMKRRYPDAEAIAAAFEAGWLKVETLPSSASKRAAKLAQGEAISLADAQVILLAETKKAVFLSDDTALRRLAAMYGLKTHDTWTLLLEALSRNLLTTAELETAMEELGRSKFKLNPKQQQEILDAAKYIQSQT
jgi:predicted nucleic acid-binding protein